MNRDWTAHIEHRRNLRDPSGREPDGHELGQFRVRRRAGTWGVSLGDHQPCASGLTGLAASEATTSVVAELRPILGGRRSVRLGFRPIVGGSPSRFDGCVVLVVGVYECLETCGPFTLVSHCVTRIGTFVADFRVSQDHGGLFDAGFNSGLMRSSTNFPLVERSLALVRDAFPFVSIPVSLNSSGFVFGATMI